MATQESDLIKRAEDFISYFNTGDWDRLREWLTSDFVYVEMGTGRRFESVDAYIQVCQEWKDAFSDASGTIHGTIASGNTVVQEVTWSGTQSGAMTGGGQVIPATGKRVEFPAALWLTFDGDKVKEAHHYFNLITMLEQLGVMPAPEQAAA